MKKFFVSSISIIFLFVGCLKLPVSIPSVSTNTVSSITFNTATCGGNVSSDGDGTVSARGVVWHTSSGPTVALSTKTNDGTGTGSFTSYLTGLIPHTTYYLRAYATNSLGTAYGNEVRFGTQWTGTQFDPNLTYGTMGDIDGTIYKTITICSQTWMAENLNASKYRNGDIIPQVQDLANWVNLTTGAWCYYNNDPANSHPYGKLYNWYALNDPRVLAPQGWHVPSSNEWTVLIDCLGGPGVAGGNMKSTGTQYFLSPNQDATNSSGFSALPGSWRKQNGNFEGIGKDAWFWGSGYNSTNAGYRVLGTSSGSVGNGNISKKNGCAVRCVKD